MIAPDFVGILPDLPNDDYHAEQAHLSSSRLKALLPEHFKTGGSTEALSFGTLFHEVVLEPHLIDGYAVLDAAAIAGDNPKTGKPYDAPQMTAKFKAAVAEAEQDGKTVVAQADLDRAFAMRDAVMAHDTARRLLENATKREESAFWIDDQGIAHKARFDGRGPGFVLDLKSTSAKPGERSLRYAVRDYGYHLSADHYLTGARALDLDADHFALIFVTKTEPYYVTVAELGPDLLAEGAELRAEALRRITDPTADAYPGASGYITL